MRQTMKQDVGTHIDQGESENCAAVGVIKEDVRIIMYVGIHAQATRNINQRLPWLAVPPSKHALCLPKGNLKIVISPQAAFQLLLKMTIFLHLD